MPAIGAFGQSAIEGLDPETGEIAAVRESPRDIASLPS